MTGTLGELEERIVLNPPASCELASSKHERIAPSDGQSYWPVGMAVGSFR